MPTLKEYFADAKIEPQDRGTSAFETAGRRIGGFYEQIARGDQQLGQDIGKAWEQAKFGLDAEDSRNRGGGSLSIKGGVNTPISFGKPWSGGGRIDNSSPILTPVGPRYNARAAQEISGGSANIAALANKLVNGQGLTDQQYQQMNLTPEGRALAQRIRTPQGDVGVYGKAGVQPTPDVTDEQAQKAGFDVNGMPINYDKQTPSYPWSSAQYGPPIMARDKNGAVTGSNVPGGSPLDPNSPNDPDAKPTLGSRIWSGITSSLTAPPPSDGGQAPGFDNGGADTGASEPASPLE